MLKATLSIVDPQLRTNQWTIWLSSPQGDIPNLELIPQFVTPSQPQPQEYLWPRATLWGGTAASVRISHVQVGTAPISGTFSLVFAGYGRSDWNYTVLNTMFPNFAFSSGK